MRSFSATLALMFCVFYGFFLVAFCPSDRIFKFARDNGLEVNYRSLQGTFWRGGASGLRIGEFALGDYAWRGKLGALLTGCAEFDVTANPDARRPMSGALGICASGRRYARDWRGALEPEPWLARFAPMPVRTGGEIEITIQRLAWGAGESPALTGELVWKQAGLGVGRELELGTIRARLTQEGESLVAHLRGRDGEVSLDGRAVYAADGGSSLHAELAALAPGADEELARWLPRQPQGGFLLDLRGRLAMLP